MAIYKYHFFGKATLKSERTAILAAKAYDKVIRKSKGSPEDFEKKYDATWHVSTEGEALTLDLWGNNKKDIEPKNVDFDDTVARILQKIPGTKVAGMIFSRCKLDHIKAFLSKNRMTESHFEEL